MSLLAPRFSGRLLAPAVCLAAFGCWSAAAANADVFGTISLLSASPFEQAQYAHDPDISEDGRYIVFDGSVAGVIGVWRREVQPGGSIEEVAGGDAELPSVSANGQYVSFTTNEGSSLAEISDGLSHSERPESPGVYVRNMALAYNEPGAFTLASAKNNSSESLSYEFETQPGETPEEQAEAEQHFGSTAAGRSAISANGNEVAFVTTATSDLAGPGTPPLQVALRYVESKKTQLVSVLYDPATGSPAVNAETGEPEPVPDVGGHGAVYSTGSPPPFERIEGRHLPQLAGASVSGDGTTVAWLGEQISEQAKTLSAEVLAGRYAEPLWRRVADGQQAPTRRVVGGSEPENPECEAHPESHLPSVPSAADPCQGPFATQDSGGYGTLNTLQLIDGIPRLSKNGNDVAFLASAPLVRTLGGFGLGGGELNDDVYWAEMSQPAKIKTLQQLTEFASGDKSRISTNAEIEDVGISPSGRQVAFTTQRTIFPLGTPTYVSAPAAAPGLLELFDVDLDDETLTRVTHGYEGGPSAHPEVELGNEDPYQSSFDGALSPSFSEEGGLLAFSSTASNLVYGDGNTPPTGSKNDFFDGADAFAVARVIFNPEPTPQIISAAPPSVAPQPRWQISVSARSLANGTVRLVFTLPGSGQLSARASSSLPSKRRERAGRARIVHVSKTVAHAGATASPGTEGEFALVLPLTAAYRKLAAKSGGLVGRVLISFAAAGHPTLHGTVTVHFKRKPGATHR